MKQILLNTVSLQDTGAVTDELHLWMLRGKVLTFPDRDVLRRVGVGLSRDPKRARLSGAQPLVAHDLAPSSGEHSVPSLAKLTWIRRSPYGPVGVIEEVLVCSVSASLRSAVAD